MKIGTYNSSATKSTFSRAFTLIELLVVIAIIGILAALVLSGTAYASKRAKIDRIRTELRELETAIENYKAKLGFYPPDNSNSPSDPAQAPLYYELVGVYELGGGSFRTADDRETITGANINSFFFNSVPTAQGFANTSPTKSEALERSFLPGLAPKKMLEISATPDIEVLRPSVNGSGGMIPRWHYVSANPVHNPKSYDLWADIVIGSETNRIANWKTGR